MKNEITENWDTYIARYEEGIPGSTTLRMDLINSAPLKDYPFALITGLNYKSERDDRFPQEDALEEIHTREEKIVKFVSFSSDTIHVGTFMSDFQRLQFFYMKSDMGIEKKLKEFYSQYYAEEEFFLLVEQDKEWKHYREFLYPNQSTLNYMADQKVLRYLESEGDDLSKSRRVDHWIYFDSQKKLDRFIELVVANKFNIEKVDKIPIGKKNLQIQIWRNDYVDSIHEITRNLREIANQNDGEYDGWETFVTK